MSLPWAQAEILVCPINPVKNPNIFILLYDKEKQQIFQFERLDAVNSIWHFVHKWTETEAVILQIVSKEIYSADKDKIYKNHIMLVTLPLSVMEKNDD